jgi:hypothetical protein
MAIIYSYPENNNILPTDILVCTSTALINGKPKNQTKNISIADLIAIISTNSSDNLNDILTNGNTSLLNADIGRLGLFDTIAQNYGGLKLNAGEFVLSDANGPVVKLNGSNISFSNIIVGMGGGDIDTNTALGYRALADNTLGFENTAIGGSALRDNIIGYRNVAVGEGALKNHIGNETTSIGHGALQLNTIGLKNTAIGAFALNANLVGGSNTAVGNKALKANTGSYNTAIGDLALSENTTGENNTAIGYLALDSNSSGSYNVAIGSSTLSNLQSNIENTAIGHGALKANEVNGNTAVGAFALNDNTIGPNNIAVGSFASNKNQNGGYNTAIGRDALKTNVSSNFNTAIGYRSLFNNTSAFNTAIGPFALTTNIFGNNTIAIGYRSGEGVQTNLDFTSSNTSIFIGDFTRPQADSQVNQIVIGYQVIGRGSNTTVIGTSGTLRSYIQGDLYLEQVVPLNYANDAAAAGAGIGIGGLYHTAGVIKIRIV